MCKKELQKAQNQENFQIMEMFEMKENRSVLSL